MVSSFSRLSSTKAGLLQPWGCCRAEQELPARLLTLLSPLWELQLLFHFQWIFIMGPNLGEIEPITLGNLKFLTFHFLGGVSIQCQRLGEECGSLAELSLPTKHLQLSSLLNSPSRIPRGPVQQPLEDRIFPPTVSAVYSTVSIPSVCLVAA